MGSRPIFRRALFAIVIVAMSLIAVPGVSAQQNRTISVTGSAEVRVVPDEVMLTLGIQTNDKDLKTAKSQNDERVAKVMAIIKSHDIPDQYIQTDYIAVDPRYHDNYTQEDFIGYFVRKRIVVRLKDVSKFEAVLSDVLEAGANYVMGIEFHTTELRKYRDQARSLAIKAAKEKAVALAGELDMKVGKATSIQEYSSGWYSPYSSFWSGSNSGMSQNVVQNSSAGGGSGGPSDADSGDTFAPGQISVTASVSVTFELE